MRFTKSRNGALALLLGTTLAIGAAGPALASGTGTAGHHPPVACPSGTLDGSGLGAAIAGLPTAEATSAQVRLTTPAGCWTGAAGVGNLRTGTPVPRDARFRIGSVTKVFTATVVLQLAAERRVDLDAPVRRYLPGLLTADYNRVTVRQLLDHTSGLPSPKLPDDIEWSIDHRYDRWTQERIVREALRNEPVFTPPGSKQQYTNMGYIVAGMLIEKVTGHSYAREMQNRIFTPLGLRDTSVPGDDPTIRGPHAHGYQTVVRDGQTELVDVTNWSQSITPAAGDIISTLADLDRFSAALFGGRLLPAAQLNEMFTLPQVDDLDGDPAAYSIGLTAFPLPTGETLWVKSGSRYGYSSAIAATRDGTFRLAFSITSTDAKGDNPTAVSQAIITAALALH
ncbi:serine hydrolase domain-containing protein [Micromonospora sp. NBC_01796]|uniref:serine hydrolase domain-containing protein n=1 Tax=Micromonospora sp. NBC_01796 TaxID=2975987 RepID=UPI002DDB835E|nr:serine hydrolase domain-containing protein [Micromonospora sp. NBC_01796]WSA88747.1 beta-lactamase family protein [Micromonospora sp. NBC_01796]